MKKITLIAMLFAIKTSFAQMPIGTVRLQALNSNVTFRGKVLNGPELGTIRYVQDGTGGIAVYSSSLAGVLRGDSVEIDGTLVDYNTLAEINPVDSFTVITSGGSLPAPQIITPLQMDESHEGELVRINNVIFANGGATFASGVNNFTSGTESGIIYVSGASLINGTQIPTSAVDLVGILSVFGSTYQLLLRDGNDIIAGATSLIQITSAVTTTNIVNNGFFLNWTTDVSGSTGVMYGLTPALELGSLSYANSSTVNHSYQFNNLLPGNIYYAAVYSVLGADTAMSQVKPYGTKSLSTGDIKIYFNDSLDNSVSTGTNAIQLYHAIDDTLIAYIDRAEHTLDLTIYDFDNLNISNISTAINAAKTRGVRVRFIGDGTQLATNFGIPQLAATIPVINSPTPSNSQGIMHNKFVVIDAKHANPTKPIVWTGSTNWTDRQINRDPNSVIIVQDQTLAKTYTLEFEEMWGDTGAMPNTTNSKFGPAKTDNTPHEFNINNKRIECYFSPSDGVTAQLINNINSANNNIYFATMLNTRADITAALMSENSQGTIVKGVINSIATGGSQFTAMQAFMNSNLVANQDTNIIMHHKYMIVDEAQTNNDPLVWISSHNWSTAANDRNNENTLVVHDATIANIYFQEFVTRFAENGGLILDVKNLTANTIKLFPTVVENINNVQYYLNDASNLQVSIYGTNGALMYSVNYANKQQGFYNLDVNTTINNGLYFVVFNANGKQFTSKIVVE